MTTQGVLVVDVGGNNVKLFNEADGGRARFASGNELTPDKLVEGVAAHTEGWAFDRVTVGCPGPVVNDRLLKEPFNLGPGWTAFDLASAFKRPTRLVNDAVMQAVGSYDGGKMLFLGLGTGLGAALVAEGAVLPLEVAHMPYKQKRTFEDYLGRRGLDWLKKKRWEKTVHEAVGHLKDALIVDYVVLGGGNAKRLAKLPEHARLGHNDRAFSGGVRLWTENVRVL